MLKGEKAVSNIVKEVIIKKTNQLLLLMKNIDTYKYICMYHIVSVLNTIDIKFIKIFKYIIRTIIYLI